MDNDLDEDVLFVDHGGSRSNKKKKTPISKWCHSFTKTVCLSLAFLALGLCIAIPGPTLLDLKERVKADTTHMLLIFSARAIGYLFGSLIGGFLFDHFDKQLLLSSTLFLAAVATTIIPWALTLVVLAVMFSLQGIAMGVLDTGGNAFCVRIWGKKSPPYMQTMHFAYGIGAFVAPLLAQPFLSDHVPGMDLNSSQSLTHGSLPVIPNIDTHSILNTSYFGSDERHSRDLYRSDEKHSKDLDRFIREIAPVHLNDSDFGKSGGRNNDVTLAGTINVNSTTSPAVNVSSSKVTTGPTAKSVIKKPQHTIGHGDDPDGGTIRTHLKENKVKDVPTTKRPITTTVAPSTTTTMLAINGVDKNGTSTHESSVVRLNETTDLGNQGDSITNQSKKDNLVTKKIAVDTDRNMSITVSSLSTANSATSIKSPNALVTSATHVKPTATTTTTEIITTKTTPSTTQPTNATSSTTIATTTPSTTQPTTATPSTTVATTTPSTTEQAAATPSTTVRKTTTTVKPTKLKSTQGTLKPATTTTQETSEPVTKVKPSIVTATKQKPSSTTVSNVPVVMTTPSNISDENTSSIEMTTYGHKPETAGNFVTDALDAIKNMSKIQFAYLIIGMLMLANAVVFLTLYCFDKHKNDFTAMEIDKERYYKSSENMCLRVIILFLMFLFFVSYIGMETTFGGLVMTFTVQYMNGTKHMGAIVTAIFWGSLAAGRGISIFIAGYCKPPWMLTIDLILVLIGAAMLSFGITMFHGIIWAGTLALGLGMSSIFPTAVSWMEQYFTLTGKSTAVLVMGSAFGQMSIPVITGYFFQNYNNMYLMYVIFALSVITVMLFVIMQLIASKTVRTSTVTRSGSGFIPLQDEDDLEMDLANYGTTTKGTARRRFMPTGLEVEYGQLPQDAEEEEEETDLLI